MKKNWQHSGVKIVNVIVSTYNFHNFSGSDDHLPFAEKTAVNAPGLLLVHPTPSPKHIESKKLTFLTILEQAVARIISFQH